MDLGRRRRFIRCPLPAPEIHWDLLGSPVEVNVDATSWPSDEILSVRVFVTTLVRSDRRSIRVRRGQGHQQRREVLIISPWFLFLRWAASRRNGLARRRPPPLPRPVPAASASCTALQKHPGPTVHPPADGRPPPCRPQRCTPPPSGPVPADPLLPPVRSCSTPAF